MYLILLRVLSYGKKFDFLFLDNSAHPMGQKQSIWEKEYNKIVARLYRNYAEFRLFDDEKHNWDIVTIYYKNIEKITELNCYDKLEIIFEENIDVNYCEWLHKLLVKFNGDSLYITIFALNNYLEYLLAYLNVISMKKIFVWNNIDNNNNYYEILKALSMKTGAHLIYTSRVDATTKETKMFLPEDEIE